VRQTWVQWIPYVPSRGGWWEKVWEDGLIEPVSNTSNIWKPHVWLCSIHSIPAITMSPSSYSSSRQPPLIPTVNNSSAVRPPPSPPPSIYLHTLQSALHLLPYPTIRLQTALHLQYTFQDNGSSSRFCLNCWRRLKLKWFPNFTFLCLCSTLASPQVCRLDSIGHSPMCVSTHVFQSPLVTTATK
jgi:hypothetical protein